MSALTLDSIRAAAEAKYGSTNIAVSPELTARLLNPLRLDKDKRKALGQLQSRLEAEDADQEALLEEALRLVAATPREAEGLLEAIGGDLAVLAATFEAYGEGTQMGEASASAA